MQRSPMAFTSAVECETKTNSNAACAELVYLAHAALAEIDVAYRERLVDEQNFGVQMNGHREREPHHHAARVCFYRLIDELANLGEVFDVPELAVDLALREAHDSGVQIDVVAPCEFRVEAGTKFK